MTRLVGLMRVAARAPLAGLPALERLNFLRRSERWSKGELAAYQARKLAKLFDFALAHSEAYAELVRSSGAIEHGRRATPPLGCLPIMVKEFVRQSGRRLTCTGYSRRFARFAFTGGSTGEPLRVVKGLGSMIWSDAMVLRGQAWAGVDTGAPGVYVKASGVSSWRGCLQQHLGGFRSVSAFPADEASAAQVAAAVRAVGAVFVSGYPSVLSMVADKMRAIMLHVPVVLTTGEMLAPSQRQGLSSRFDARVVDYYGSNEVSGIAFECECGSKHVSDEHVIVETVDDVGAPVRGVPGRIVVTDLDNFAMPFIRYEIGDLGVISEQACLCGRALTVLERIDGRTQDRVRGLHGRELSGIFFAARFRDLAQIRAYQLVQHKVGDIELRFVPAAPGAEAAAQTVAEEIRQRLGAAVILQRVAMEDLTLTARGKVRLVVGKD